jgi:hypothetical protein
MERPDGTLREFAPELSLKAERGEKLRDGMAPSGIYRRP